MLLTSIRFHTVDKKHRRRAVTLILSDAVSPLSYYKQESIAC